MSSNDSSSADIPRLPDDALRQYRIRLSQSDPVRFEKAQFFREESGPATWRINGETVAQAEEFVFNPDTPGRHELTVEYDDRRVRRALTVGLHARSLCQDTTDTVYLIVFKHRYKLYFIPIHAGSAPRDLSDRREDVRTEHERAEPVSYDFARRQNDQWKEGILPEPIISYSAVSEGIYALCDSNLYYLGGLDPVSTVVAELRAALTHDAEVTAVGEARPNVVFETMDNLVAGFDVDDLELDPGAFVTTPNWSDGGVFESFVARNVGTMVGHLGDHLDGWGVDIEQDRIGAMFAYHTQNFTFSTRLSNTDLGVSRQYTNMLGFGSGPGRESTDDLVFGGRDSGRDGSDFGRGTGFDSGSSGLGGFGIGPGGRGTGDADGFGIGFGGPGQATGGLIPPLGMFSDGDGFTLGFGRGTGQGAMMDGGFEYWVSMDKGDSSDAGIVKDVYSDKEGAVYVEHEDPGGDTSSPGVDVVFFGDMAISPGGDEAEHDDNSSDAGTGGGDDAGTGGGDDAGTGGGDDAGTGGGDDDDPAPTGTVGLTPSEEEGPFGYGSGKLPFGNLSGMSGGCRGGGYTDPTEDEEGRRRFEHLWGAICPMGVEPIDTLIQPGLDEGEDMQFQPQETLSDIMDTLINPVEEGTIYDQDSGVSIVGQFDLLPSEVDIGDDPVGPVPDGGTQTQYTGLFRLSDRTMATAMGMDRSERVVGVIDGHPVNGLFGFAGTLRIDTTDGNK